MNENEIEFGGKVIKLGSDYKFYVEIEGKQRKFNSLAAAQSAVAEATRKVVPPFVPVTYVKYDDDDDTAVPVKFTIAKRDIVFRNGRMQERYFERKAANKSGEYRRLGNTYDEGYKASDFEKVKALIARKVALVKAYDKLDDDISRISNTLYDMRVDIGSIITKANGEIE